MILFLFLGEKKEKERKRKNEKYSCQCEKKTGYKLHKTRSTSCSEWNTFFF